LQATPSADEVYPLRIQCSRRPDVVEANDILDAVSYNILSSATSSTGHYMDIHGNARDFDEEQRRTITYARLEDWMRQKKVICLQEVTSAFLYQEDRTARVELANLLNRRMYDVYAHFYNYEHKTKTKTLGLAVFVPVDRFDATDVSVLCPWKKPLRSQMLTDRLLKLDDQINSGQIEWIAQCRAKNPEATVTKKKNDDLKNEKKTLEDEQRKTIPRYNDRSVLMLRLESDGKSVLIGNIHVPCKYDNPWIATSIAFQAKQAILDWACKFDTAPLVFCGDFNSMPGQEGFKCFQGTLDYEEPFIQPDFITHDAFKDVVTNEKWTVALPVSDCCTCYALTENSVKAQKAQAASDSPESDKNTNSLSFKPRNYHLDHFFVRDKTNSLAITKRICPTLETVKTLTGDDPLPNLEIHEPSDHLPIELGLQFK
jgi:endonuclease/exonuclease/phosphatase family metal-dependent hydrolase